MTQANPVSNPLEQKQPSRWSSRWHGSPPQHGWSIVDEKTRETVVYLGPNVSTETVNEIVEAHNKTIEPLNNLKEVAWMYKNKASGQLVFVSRITSNEVLNPDENRANWEPVSSVYAFL